MAMALLCIVNLTAFIQSTHIYIMLVSPPPRFDVVLMLDETTLNILPNITGFPDPSRGVMSLHQRFAADILAPLHDYDRVGITTFGGGFAHLPNNRLELSELNANRDGATAFMYTLRTNPGFGRDKALFMDIMNTIFNFLIHPSPYDAERVIILFSDGDDMAQRLGMNQVFDINRVIEFANTHNIRIYTVNIFGVEQWQVVNMTRTALETGGMDFGVSGGPLGPLGSEQIFATRPTINRAAPYSSYQLGDTELAELLEYLQSIRYNMLQEWLEILEQEYYFGGVNTEIPGYEFVPEYPTVEESPTGEIPTDDLSTEENATEELLAEESTVEVSTDDSATEDLQVEDEPTKNDAQGEAYVIAEDPTIEELVIYLITRFGLLLR